MAHPYHHSLSSVKKFGGVVEDYLAIHSWFDASKMIVADFRHRALRHHSEGLFTCEQVYGVTITLSTCAVCGKVEEGHDLLPDGEFDLEGHDFAAKVIPTRWVGEQHVTEDMGMIPSAADFIRAIKPEPWMNRSRKLSKELENAPVPAGAREEQA